MPIFSRRKLFQAFFGGGASSSNDVLVCVFLRGGADGLNMVVPFTDDRYYKIRPTISIPRPDDRQSAEQQGGGRVIPLDGAFGLHPSLAPLHEIWQAGQLGVVHAVGSDDQTRSHFEAQDLMEYGASAQSGVSGGWLARHLRSRPGALPSSLAALAIGRVIPESLRGAPGASAVESLDEFQLGSRDESSQRLRSTLADLYAGSESAVAAMGRETLAVLETVDRLRAERYQPTGGAVYPNTDFGRSLGEVARMIKADVGLEVACVDMGGWDTHFVQGSTIGLQAGMLENLAGSLTALWRDLGERMKRVCVVVMTEFGRRAYENVSFGTDHGRAGVMFLLGGGIAGGKITADWPGLADGMLEDPGDLRVTTDYRLVLAELMAKRLGNPNYEKVFPQVGSAFKGVARG